MTSNDRNQIINALWKIIMNKQNWKYALQYIPCVIFESSHTNIFSIPIYS
jgi:hypothetical protein